MSHLPNAFQGALEGRELRYEEQSDVPRGCKRWLNLLDHIRQASSIFYGMELKIEDFIGILGIVLVIGVILMAKF